MKRSLTIISVIALLLGLGVYQLCNVVYANAKTMMNDAVEGKVENIDENLFYQMGDRYKDINNLTNTESNE